MCRLQNIAMPDYHESVTIRQTDTLTDRQTDGQTDTRQSDPYVPLCFAGDTIKHLPSNELFLEPSFILSTYSEGCYKTAVRYYSLEKNVTKKILKENRPN